MADSATPKGTPPMPMRVSTKRKRSWYTDDLLSKAFNRRERRKAKAAAAKADTATQKATSKAK